MPLVEMSFVRKFSVTAGALVVVLLTMMAVSGEASAQSLREIRAQEAQEGRLAQEAAYTSSLCRISLQTSIDWRSAANWPDDASLPGKCDGALGAIESFCKSDKGRRRVSRINAFVCAADGSGPSLNGGVLRYGADPDRNGFGETRRYLEGKL